MPTGEDSPGSTKTAEEERPQLNFLEEAGVPQGFLQIAYAKSW